MGPILQQLHDFGNSTEIAFLSDSAQAQHPNGHHPSTTTRPTDLPNTTRTFPTSQLPPTGAFVLIHSAVVQTGTSIFLDLCRHVVTDACQASNVTMQAIIAITSETIGRSAVAPSRHPPGYEPGVLLGELTARISLCDRFDS